MTNTTDQLSYPQIVAAFISASFVQYLSHLAGMLEQQRLSLELSPIRLCSEIADLTDDSLVIDASTSSDSQRPYVQQSLPTSNSSPEALPSRERVCTGSPFGNLPVSKSMGMLQDTVSHRSLQARDLHIRASERGLTSDHSRTASDIITDNAVVAAATPTCTLFLLLLPQTPWRS